MKTDLGHRPTRWVWLGPDERGGYPSGPKRVSELKPPPRTPGIGATQRSDESLTAKRYESVLDILASDSNILSSYIALLQEKLDGA